MSFKSVGDKHRIEHALRSCNERYDIDLTLDQYYRLIKKIQKQDGRFEKSLSNSVSIWILNLNDNEFRVMYSKTIKLITTFLIYGKVDDIEKIIKHKFKLPVSRKFGKQKRIR